MLEAAFAFVYDAGQVRLAQFAQTYFTRKAKGLPVDRVVAQLRHLHNGLEAVALLPVGRDRDLVVALLIETYGLLAVAQDPFLRPLLPPVPTTGSLVRRLVLGIGGNALRVNTSLVALGGELIATPVGYTPPPAPTAPIITNATFSAGGPVITSVTFTAP